MNIFQAIIFGAVQGLTEFLPISSTAHLILLPWFLGWPDPGLAFDVALHLGTLVALLIYFRADWIALITSAARMVRGRTQSPDARMAMLIVGATTPARKSPPLNQISSRNMPRPERIKMISVQVTGLFRSAHMVVPSSLQRSPAAPSRPNGWDRPSRFLEYLGDAQNHSRMTELHVVARQHWRNSRFARAMVMAMR